MNLVCFPNNTAGGLVCDLLNGKSLKFDGYKTQSEEHDVLKLGDTPTVQTSIDPDEWFQLLLTVDVGVDRYYGTHAHPSCIPDLSIFDDVIIVSTETRTSKLYRWLRYYNGWFRSADPTWQESDELHKIDQIRILAYNVFEPYPTHPGCKSIEFEDIVDGKFVEEYGLDVEQFSKWQAHNPWLYSDIKSWAEYRFDEAEYELVNNIPYKYI